ncbi:MAG: phage tail sheath subtilisin-like domain-containing protein [Chloroflexi bacterium]|nr:phage tail sheath subtilisin-like domain-containing protein [Chloroflexota bacterium]
MATTYLSPGVYVEEIQQGTRPIQGVGTSLTAFVGITSDASIKRLDAKTGQEFVVESRLNKPTLVTSWTSYTKIFGEFVSGAYLPDAVYGYFANGGGPCYVTSIRAMNEVSATDATAAKATIPSAKGDSFTVTAKLAGDVGNNLAVTVANEVDADGKATGAFSLTVGKQTATGLTMKKSDDKFVGSAAFENVTISEVGNANSGPVDGTYVLSGGGIQPLSAADFIGSAAKRTGLEGLEGIDEVRLITCPDLMVGYDGTAEAKERVRSVQSAIVAHCERLRYRFAILDTPPGLSPQEVLEWREYVNFDTSYAALYYPWVQIPDLVQGGTRMSPPSGYVAGVYNRTDSSRGVHKAPANEILMGVVALETGISRGEQDQLNPRGVNCIRAFAGTGIRIWGARTLSSDGAWRYINVRRLFIYVAASMDAGLQWVVFEPNSSTLWAKVRRDVTAFLRTVWGSGALFGASEGEAFYVKCDGELNSADVRDLGQLIIEVGISPVKPAEFVIFRLSQWAGADAESE